MKKFVLVYGVISGTIVTLMLIICFGLIVDNNHSESNMVRSMIVNFTSQFLAMSFIFVATHSYKKKVLGGTIKFWPALKIGLLISLIASTMYVITWVILYKTGSSVVIEAMAQKEISGLNDPEAIKEAESRWAFYRTYPGLISFTYMEILPTGILFSLISAFIFWLTGKKKKNDTVTQ